MKRNYSYGDKFLARQLRRDMTTAEVVLWQYLRKDQVGYHFRRQHPIGTYVLDFFCDELKLCIELDGEVHENRDISIRDMQRTEYLNNLGITVLRFSNDVVFHQVDGLLDSIRHFANHPVMMAGWHKNEFIGNHCE